MDNYYEHLLSLINQALAGNDFRTASQLIEAELGMPYVPLYVETQLNELKRQIPAAEAQPKRLVDDYEELARLLMGSNTQQASAIEYLNSLNIRHYLPLIKEYLDHSEEDMLKSILIGICIRQGIAEELTVEKDGCRIDFIPQMIEDPLTTDGYIRTKDLLTDWLINDDPSLLTMTLDVLMQLIYLKLPEAYGEDEAMALAQSIIRYVLLALDDEDRWIRFMDEQAIDGRYLIEIHL